jgi:RecA/RadA recombinase
MANRWLTKLQKIDGAVKERRDPHKTVIRTHSPSVNMAFGLGHGLPLGYSLVLYGPPKGGKSLLVNSMIGTMHQSDPEAIAVRFNTEMRESGQLGPDSMVMWGIDPERYVGIEANTPDGVFDAIEKDLGALCQEGAPIKLVVIDSVNAIQGRRQMNNESVMQQTIGDLALTVGEGLKRILAVQRKYNFALILVTQVRAEMDPMQVAKGQKTKMAAGFALMHHAEYFAYVERNDTKAGRTSLSGNEFVSETLSDIADKAERTGHKIRFCMKDSSLGPKGRMGEFTLDYSKGIINTHEEVFLLGVNRGVIDKPNQLSYKFGERSWKGQQAMLEALKTDKELYDAVLNELMRRDRESGLPLTPEEVASAQEESAS